MPTTINVSKYNVELRSKNGVFKGYLTPWVTKVSWEWNRLGGCGRCSITINKAYRDITFDARDDIQIRVKSGSTSKLVYRGYIANIIPTLKINQDIRLDIRGYFDLLNKVVINDAGDTETYANKEVSVVVNDIVENFIVGTHLSNGNVEVWTAGASAAPDSWTLGGLGSPAVAREGTIKKLGAYSAKLTNGNGNTANLNQAIHATLGIDYWKGKQVTIGAWVYCATASRAQLIIDDNVGTTASSFHTGDSTWQWIEVTRTIDSSATAITVYLWIATGTVVSAYYDGIVAVEGATVSDMPITRGLIDAGSFTIDSIDFLCTVTEALKTLSDLTSDIEYGVDEDLVFYWRTESETITHKFFVGNNVSMLERRVNWDELVNKIYLVGGDVAGVKYKRTAENTDSQDQYYLAEQILNNSSITTQTVADQYLSALLTEKANPQYNIRAKIENTDVRIEDTIPLGLIAFYDATYDRNSVDDAIGDIIGEAADGGSDITIGLTADGGDNVTIGGQYSAQVDRLSYELSDTDGRFNIEIQLGDTVLETAAKIKKLELALSSLTQY